MLADITISLVCVTPYTYILWRYWDSVLVPVSGPSQELICQEARNHFPDSTLFPERSRPLTLFCPLPQHTQPRAPLTESSSLWCVHFQSHALLENVCMFKSRSFIHKRETQGNIISLDLYSQCFSDSLFWLWGRQRQWVTQSRPSVAHVGKTKMWLRRQGLRFMGMLRSSLCHKLHCISAGQATHLCQSTSWENALPLKDSPKLLQPNPFRGQEGHKATPRNPFKLMMKWLKWGHFCLKDTKHCRGRVGSQNHRIS